MSAYDTVQKGSLKLKGISDGSVKKKHKKKHKKEKEMKKMLEQVSSSDQAEGGESSKRKIEVDKRTPAEIAFAKEQEKRNVEKIIQIASKTHKERIMEFNQGLDNLSEHFDIPKVSWTK